MKKKGTHRNSSNSIKKMRITCYLADGDYFTEVNESDVILDPVCGSADFLITIAKLKGSGGYCIEPNEELANEAVRKIREYNLDGLLTVLNTVKKAEIFD